MSVDTSDKMVCRKCGTPVARSFGGWYHWPTPPMTASEGKKLRHVIVAVSS